MKIFTHESDGHVAEILADASETWRACEQELGRREVPVPLAHRAEWIDSVDGEARWLVVVRDPKDQGVAAAFPLRAIRTRSLPGHLRLRATRVGYAPGVDGLLAGISALRELVRDQGRILGVNLECFLPSADERILLESRIADIGFERVRRAGRYRFTPRVDLERPLEEVMGSFSRSCRRNIRQPEKDGLRVTALSDPEWAVRMDELWRETFQRTGAVPPLRDWERRLAFAGVHPHLYHVIGVFDPGEDGPGSLIAFACAEANGDHATYADGASTRERASTAPLGYAPLWHLISWAHAQGYPWMDLGGISDGTAEDEDDPVGGISDFKRRFSEDVIEVGSEWEFEVPSIRGFAAGRMSDLGTLIRRFTR